MRKKWWILIIALVVIILFIPTKKMVNDGGTIEYSAVLYKVIKWNRMRVFEENKTGTEIYWFPENIHSLDYYDAPRPNAVAFGDASKYVVTNIGSYQWSKDVDGQTIHIIADAIGPLQMEYKETLKIKQGQSIKSVGLISDVTQITTYKYEGEKAQKIENQLIYDEINQEIDTSKMEKGVYIIELFVEKGQDNVLYSFKLEILDEDEISKEPQNETNSQTFYAEIKNINNTSLLVDGLEVNDINYRGEFSFKITEETKLEWRNTTIDISDLDEGDNISITFEGEIQETYPANINDVVRIQLLDNEK